MDDNWTLSSLDDDAWKEMFNDDLERERWQTNFGKDAESAEKASYWRDMVQGIEPSVAAIYNKQGLTPYEIGDFHDAGISDYQEILGWKRVSADPAIATAFKEKGVNPETYEKWSKIGVQDPDMMIRFAEDLKIDLSHLERFVSPLVDKELITLQDVPKWLENGVKLEELASWVSQGFKYPSLVKAWKMLRMKPADAKEWEKVVAYPREAARWIQAGYFKANDVAGLIKQGYTSPEQIEAESENVIIKTR
jgi:hypothetical protein